MHRKRTSRHILSTYQESSTILDETKPQLSWTTTLLCLLTSVTRIDINISLTADNTVISLNKQRQPSDSSMAWKKASDKNYTTLSPTNSPSYYRNGKNSITCAVLHTRSSSSRRSCQNWSSSGFIQLTEVCNLRFPVSLSGRATSQIQSTKSNPCRASTDYSGQARTMMKYQADKTWAPFSEILSCQAQFLLIKQDAYICLFDNLSVID